MIYCHDCQWGQDDFWEQSGYNPLRSDIINELKDSLFKDRIYFDSWFFRDNLELNPDGIDQNGSWLKGTTYVAWSLRERAKRIENMIFCTSEEFEARGSEKWVCPKCDGRLGVD